MKFVYPGIDHVFDTASSEVNTLIIENQRLFSGLIQDICFQIQGLDGKAVVSCDGKILPMDKYVELHDRFIPFEINRRNILTKLYAMIEKLSSEGGFFHDTVQIKGEVEHYLSQLSLSIPYDIDFQGIDIAALLKAADVRFSEEYPNLSEKLLDYCGIVKELERNKLFIIVNLRSYVSDLEAEQLFSSLVSRNIDVLLIENTERKRLVNEKRYIIDASLCEIS